MFSRFLYFEVFVLPSVFIDNVSFKFTKEGKIMGKNKGRSMLGREVEKNNNEQSQITHDLLRTLSTRGG